MFCKQVESPICHEQNRPKYENISWIRRRRSLLLILLLVQSAGPEEKESSDTHSSWRKSWDLESDGSGRLQPEKKRTRDNSVTIEPGSDRNAELILSTKREHKRNRA